MAEPASLPPAVPPSPWAAAVLLLMVFVSIIGMGIVIPLLPFYGSAFDAEPWQVTLLFAGFSGGQFLGELTWGRLSDRIGRRPVILITILGAGLGYLGLAYSPGIWIALAARVFGGFFAGNMSAIQGYIVDVTPPEKLAGRLGLIGSAFGVGFVVGPSLGGFLAVTDHGAAGFRPPLLLAAGLCVLAAVGAILFLRESNAPHARRRGPGPIAAVRQALADPVLKRLMGSTFFAFMGLSAMWSILGLWGQARFGWGPSQIGAVMAAAGLASAISQGGVAGMIIARLGEVRSVVTGLTLAALFIALEAAAPPVALAIALVILSGTSHTLSQPATTSLISKAAPPDRQGATLGANAATSSLSRVMGPMISGFIFSAVGPNAPFVFSAAVLVPAAYLAWRGGHAIRRRDA